MAARVMEVLVGRGILAEDGFNPSGLKKGVTARMTQYGEAALERSAPAGNVEAMDPLHERVLEAEQAIASEYPDGDVKALGERLLSDMVAIFQALHDRDELDQHADLLVMGYSGNDDFDIIPFINESAEFSKLIWIDHADITTPEIIEFIPREQSSSSSSKVDQALQEIANERKAKIVKIKAHTRRFVQEVLSKQIAGVAANQDTMAANPGVCSGPGSRPPSFPEWIARQDRYARVPDHQKWMLAGFVHNNLGMIDRQMHCYEQAVSMCNSDALMEDKTRYLTYLGDAYRMQGNPSAALKTFNDAMDLVERSGKDK